MVSLDYLLQYVSKRGESHEAIQRKSDTGLACFPHCKWYIVYGRQVGGFFWRTLVVPINRAFEWNDLYTVTK